jgi:hypothetical protein
LSVEVPTASFGPEVVKKKASEDVERLTSVREAASVVALEVRGVVFLFEDRFPQKDERPGDGEAVGRLPFDPDATESVPSLASGGAFHKAVLGRFREVLIAAFVGSGEPHVLEPRAHREPFIEGQPDEGFDLARAGIVPHPGHNLSCRGVSEVQTLDEVDDPGGVVWFSGVLVAPLGGVSEERSVSQFVRLLPMPISGVPLEVGNKSESEDPVEQGFLTREGEVFG